MADAHPLIVDVIRGPGVEPHVLLVIGSAMARLPLTARHAARLISKLAEYLADAAEPA
jgi:hypothetical protein